MTPPAPRTAEFIDRVVAFLARAEVIRPDPFDPGQYECLFQTGCGLPDELSLLVWGVLPNLLVTFEAALLAERLL